jgi:hypothetical protein
MKINIHDILFRVFDACVALDFSDSFSLWLMRHIDPFVNITASPISDLITEIYNRKATLQDYREYL